MSDTQVGFKLGDKVVSNRLDILGFNSFYDAKYQKVSMPTFWITDNKMSR